LPKSPTISSRSVVSTDRTNAATCPATATTASPTSSAKATATATGVPVTNPAAPTAATSIATSTLRTSPVATVTISPIADGTLACSPGTTDTILPTSTTNNTYQDCAATGTTGTTTISAFTGTASASATRDDLVCRTYRDLTAATAATAARPTTADVKRQYRAGRHGIAIDRSLCSATTSTEVPTAAATTNRHDIHCSNSRRNRAAIVPKRSIGRTTDAQNWCRLRQDRYCKRHSCK